MAKDEKRTLVKIAAFVTIIADGTPLARRAINSIGWFTSNLLVLCCQISQFIVIAFFAINLSILSIAIEFVVLR